VAPHWTVTGYVRPDGIVAPVLFTTCFTTVNVATAGVQVNELTRVMC